MANSWYLRRDQKVFGPFDSARLKQLAEAKKITPATEISQAANGPWTTAAKVKGLFPSPQSSPGDAVQSEPPPIDAPPPLPATNVTVVEAEDTPAAKGGILNALTTARQIAATSARAASELVVSSGIQDTVTSAASASKGIVSGLFAKKEKEAGLLESYTVVYRGGHPAYPDEKVTAIEFKVFGDRFEFHPTASSKSWFYSLIIYYDTVRHFEIAERQVGTMEVLLGGINSRQLNQPNNIHIEYESGSGATILIRFEMLTGVTVMGQAKVCRALLDRLRNAQVLDQITRREKPSIQAVVVQPDIPGQIEKLAALREKGILTQEEFETKKAELLAKM